MQLRGTGKAVLIVGVLVAVGVWIASGVLTRDDGPEEAAAPAEQTAATVAVRLSRAEPVERLLVLQGDLQPQQVVLVRAETGGQVEQWHVPRGAAVERGDLLAQLELGERRAQLRQAEARLNVAEQQLRATRQLVAEGYEPEIQLDTARAELEAAQADLAAIQEDISHTRIRAPIPGRVDRRIAERGDFVAAGAEVAQIVDNDPLRATVQVPQHSIDRVRVGQPARVEVLRYGEAAGEVTFVSSLADPATRTFRVEVEVANPERRLPAGTSAEVAIPTDEVPAHRVSPAIIGLDDAGRVGVKTVDGDDVVRFHPVEVVRAEPDGVWVAGLPEEARIITVGQGFVSAGQSVVARPEQELEAEQEETAAAAGPAS